MRDKYRFMLRRPSFKHSPKKPALPPREKIKKREALTMVLTCLSILTVLLALLGYGVAAAAEELNIGYETLFTSPFELIQLSPWAFDHIFRRANAADFFRIYLQAIRDMFPGFAISAVILICGALIWKKEKFLNKSKSLVFRHIILKVPLKKQDSGASIIAKIAAFSGIMSVFIPALLIVATFFILTATAFVIMLPGIGLAAGNAHIRKDVLLPEHCSPLRNSLARLKAPVPVTAKKEIFATCVRVTDGRTIDESGRLVFSTSSAVLLYNPTSGRATRIPTRNVTIQAIESVTVQLL